MTAGNALFIFLIQLCVALVRVSYRQARTMKSVHRCASRLHRHFPDGRGGSPSGWAHSPPGSHLASDFWLLAPGSGRKPVDAGQHRATTGGRNPA